MRKIIAEFLTPNPFTVIPGPAQGIEPGNSIRLSNAYIAHQALIMGKRIEKNLDEELKSEPEIFP